MGDGEKELFRNIIGSLKNIIELSNGNNIDKVTLSCKMESLAQRYAKEILLDAGHNFKYKHYDEKNGIFIDDEQESMAVMHRLSEIARYKPEQLDRLVNGNENWLLHEYMQAALDQFVDEMASEITGREVLFSQW